MSLTQDPDSNPWIVSILFDIYSSSWCEERVSRKEVLESNVDVIINVVDASSLERNLYLTMQLLELGKPVIVALNMMDIVEERGMEIDLHRLPEVLGDIPVVPVSARKRTGLDVLMHAVVHHYQEIPDENLHIKIRKRDCRRTNQIWLAAVSLVSAIIESFYGFIRYFLV